MKILTGELKGRDLIFKKNPYLRPTADKVKKALFDVLKGAVEGKKVLDLFSGTGGLGIEALSNGAASVTFVESHYIQASTIGKTVERLGIKNRAEVLCEPAIDAIVSLSRQGVEYDIILMDPPYESEDGLKAFFALTRSKILAADAIVVVECKKRAAYPKEERPLKLLREKEYGDTRLLFYGA